MPALCRQYSVRDIKLSQPVLLGNQTPPRSSVLDDLFSNSSNTDSEGSGSGIPFISPPGTTTPSPASMKSPDAKTRLADGILNPYSKASLFDGPLTPIKTRKRWTMPSPSRFDEEVGIDEIYMGPRSRGYQVRARKPKGVVKAKKAKPSHTASHWVMGPDRLMKVAVWKEPPIPKARRDAAEEEMAVLFRRKQQEDDLLAQFPVEEHVTDLEQDIKMDIDGIDADKSRGPAQLGPEGTVMIDQQEENRMRFANQIEATYPEKWIEARTGILRAYTTEIIE